MEPQPGKTQEKTKQAFCGFTNLGSTIYMDGIFQLLYFTPEFRKSILDINLGEIANKDRHKDISVVKETQELFRKMTNERGTVINHTALCKAIDMEETGENNPSDYIEQLHLFLDKIDTACKKLQLPEPSNSSFAFELDNQLICSRCRVVKSKIEQSITVPLSVKNTQNIYSSFEKFVTPELLDDWYCDNCRQKSEVSKGVLFNKFNKELLCGLTRFEFSYDTFQTQKIVTKHAFELSVDASDYSNSEQDPMDLYAVVAHYSFPGGGHYSIYVRDVLEEAQESKESFSPTDKSYFEERVPRTPQTEHLYRGWYQISDSTVKTATVQDLERLFQGQNCSTLLAYRQRSLNTQNETIKASILKAASTS